MKSIKRRGLVGLLTAGLSFGALFLEQSYAEHKGKIREEMVSERGYSLILVDKTMPNEARAFFDYRVGSKRAVIVSCMDTDKVTQGSMCITLYKHGVGPNSQVVYLKPDSVSTSMNRENAQVEPSVSAFILWEDYLKALHQEKFHKKWIEKYFRR